MLLVASLINNANSVAYFVYYLELGPVVGEVLRREVNLLDALLPVFEDLGLLGGLGEVIVFVDGKGVVFVVEGLFQFLVALGGDGGEGFDEDGYSEVVL